MRYLAALTQLSRRSFPSNARSGLGRAFATTLVGEDSRPAGYGEYRHQDRMEEEEEEEKTTSQMMMEAASVVQAAPNGETNPSPHPKEEEEKQDYHVMNQTVKWMDPEEMEYLFHLAAKQKQELQEQLTDIQRALVAAKT